MFSLTIFPIIYDCWFTPSEVSQVKLKLDPEGKERWKKEANHSRLVGEGFK